MSISIANNTSPRPPRQRWANSACAVHLAPFVLCRAHAPIYCVPLSTLNTIQPPTSLHCRVVARVGSAHRSFNAFEMSEALRDGRKLRLSAGLRGHSVSVYDVVRVHISSLFLHWCYSVRWLSVGAYSQLAQPFHGLGSNPNPRAGALLHRGSCTAVP